MASAELPDERRAARRRTRGLAPTRQQLRGDRGRQRLRRRVRLPQPEGAGGPQPTTAVDPGTGMQVRGRRQLPCCARRLRSRSCRGEKPRHSDRGNGSANCTTRVFRDPTPDDDATPCRKCGVGARIGRRDRPRGSHPGLSGEQKAELLRGRLGQPRPPSSFLSMACSHGIFTTETRRHGER